MSLEPSPIRRGLLWFILDRSSYAGEGRSLHFQRLDIWTNGFDNTDAFVAKNHIIGFVVLIGSTDAGVGDFEVDFIFGKCWAVGRAFDDVARGRALEYFEIVGSHFAV